MGKNWGLLFLVLLLLNQITALEAVETDLLQLASGIKTYLQTHPQLDLETKRNLAFLLKLLDKQVTDSQVLGAAGKVINQDLEKLNSFLGLAPNSSAVNGCTSQILPHCLEVPSAQIFACVKNEVVSHCTPADQARILQGLTSFLAKFSTAEMNHNAYDVHFSNTELDPSGVLGSEIDLHAMEKWFQDKVVVGHADASLEQVPPVLNPYFHASKLPFLLNQIAQRALNRLHQAKSFAQESLNVTLPLGEMTTEERPRKEYSC